MWNLMEYPETSKYAQVGRMGNVFVGNARVCADVEIERNFRFLRGILERKRAVGDNSISGLEFCTVERIPQSVRLSFSPPESRKLISQTRSDRQIAHRKKKNPKLAPSPYP